MTEEEKNRQIAMRFLKEVGIFPEWRQYIRSKMCKNPDSWHKVKRIDSIFGKQNFTDYLEKKHSIRLTGTISELFRAYVRKTYPDLPINSLYGIAEDGDIFINKETGAVHIKRINY